MAKDYIDPRNDWDEDNEVVQPKTYIREKKKHAKPGVHVPAKREGELLRKLMSDTGLSEKEIREHKKYRKMLSDTQKQEPKLSKRKKAEKDLMKSITKYMKLAKEHPLVQAEFKKQWHEKYGRGFCAWF